MRFLKSILAAIALMLPIASASAQSVRVEFVVTSQYSGGFVCNVKLTNTGTVSIPSWSMLFDWNTAFASAWSAVHSSVQQGAGFRHTALNESWNGVIAPSATVSWGFEGIGAFQPTVTNCTVNGSAATVIFSGGGGGGGSTPFIAIESVPADADSFSVNLGAQQRALTLSTGSNGSGWTVKTNNADVVVPEIAGNVLQLQANHSGLASLTLTEASSGASRILGIAVRTATGAMPKLPRYLALGSVCEDITSHLDFFRAYQPGAKNRFVDIRYIYINGGPISGWRTWTSTAGDRAAKYIKESKKLGMIPCFVFYNVPDNGESLSLDIAHLQDAAYMTGYWKDLDLFCDLVRAGTSDGWPSMIVLEPDLLGYFAQVGYSATGSQVQPRNDLAHSNTGYDGTPILTSTDPTFPNNVRGFVESLNYIIDRDCPSAIFGWQMNLWASPPGGFAGTPIPGNGLCRLTDTYGITSGRAKITAEASGIADWYIGAGVLTHGADFLSIDKYGLDAVGQSSDSATNPSVGPWFFNADHWGNYLLFAKAMHDRSSLPVVLWQIPVGRVNSTLSVSPYTNAPFLPLSNVVQYYEDSASTFFFGDSFTPGSSIRQTWFGANQGMDPLVSSSGSTVNWGSHMQATADAGVVAFLAGAGVGASTTNTPPSSQASPDPTDGYFWISKAQAYYANPVILQSGSIMGDINRDGFVNASDLTQILAGWGSFSAQLDLSGNGVVEAADLTILLVNWTG